MLGGNLWFKLSINLEWISVTFKLIKCQILGWIGVKE